MKLEKNHHAPPKVAVAMANREYNINLIIKQQAEEGKVNKNQKFWLLVQKCTFNIKSNGEISNVKCCGPKH